MSARQFDGAFLMTGLTKLWIALGAVAITALLTVAAGLLASGVMGMMSTGPGKWWWPLVIRGATIASLMTPFVPLGIALYGHRRRVRSGTFPHSAGLGRPPR
jgi:hypothetical protein